MTRRDIFRRVRRTASWVFVPVLLALLPAPLLAAIRTVHADGSGPYPTIQAAFDASSSGDIVELTNGVFMGPGNRDLDLDIDSQIIRSQSGDPDLVIVDTEGFPLGMAGGWPPLTIQGIQFRNSIALDLNVGYVVYSNCIFDHCAGVAYAGFGDSAELHGCVIRNLTATGLSAGEGSLEAFDCTFIDNHFVRIASGSSLEFTNCSFLGNEASALGLVRPGSTMFEGQAHFTGCTFADNTGVVGSACISANTYLLSIDDCIFARNSITCLALSPGQSELIKLDLRRSTFVDNSGPATIQLEEVGEFGGTYDLTLSRSIFAFQDGGTPIDCGGLSPNDYPTVACCDIFGNSGGDYVDCLSGLEGIDGNLSLDPRFCPADLDTYTLQSSSPCRPLAPENPTCGLIGASVVGCSVADVSDDTSGDTSGDPSLDGRSWLVASPNPSHGSTMLRWRPSVADEPVLFIHDAAGRIVRRLRGVPAISAAEMLTAQWDGADNAGREVPGGVYYLRDGARPGARRSSVVVLR